MRPRGVLVLLALVLGLIAATPAGGHASPAPALRADGAALEWTPVGTQDVYTLLTDGPGGRTLSAALGWSRLHRRARSFQADDQAGQVDAQCPMGLGPVGDPGAGAGSGAGRVRCVQVC